MHALLVVMKDTDEGHLWRLFGQSVDNETKQHETTWDIGVGSWLIDLNSALPVFCGLVQAAERAKIPYRVHFFHEPPIWIESSKIS